MKIAEALQTRAEKKKYNKIDFYYPDTGLYSRDKYPEHMAFMEAGANHLIRAYFAGNGVGKTTCGAAEFVYHMTGRYPAWWPGKKFTKPLNAWACARETKQLREGIQECLFGGTTDETIGTGFIPRAELLDDKGNVQTWAMAGTPNCIGIALIRHYTNGVFDGYSKVEFKTYAQGWQEFQGANRDLIWMDEEPDDAKVFAECLTRTRGPRGKEGILYVTFTPLLGYTSMYLSFVPRGKVPKNGEHPDNPQKYVVVSTWETCPHLSEEWKKSAIESYKLSDPNSINARINGIAALGSGRVFPIDEDFVVVRPFQIPEYWCKAYGLDFGWKNTACVWIAQDPGTKVKYVYAEYKRGEVVDLIHIAAIKALGEWMTGAADPSKGGRKDDGSLKMDDWNSKGLNLIPGKNALIPSIGSLLSKFESGALKIMSSCQNLIDEIRSYRYDTKNPNIPAPNQDDHEIDALRYIDSMFDFISSSEHDALKAYDDDYQDSSFNDSRDDLTGY